MSETAHDYLTPAMTDRERRAKIIVESVAMELRLISRRMQRGALTPDEAQAAINEQALLLKRPQIMRLQND